MFVELYARSAPAGSSVNPRLLTDLGHARRNADCRKEDKSFSTSEVGVSLQGSTSQRH